MKSDVNEGSTTDKLPEITAGSLTDDKKPDSETKKDTKKDKDADTDKEPEKPLNTLF